MMLNTVHQQQGSVDKVHNLTDCTCAHICFNVDRNGNSFVSIAVITGYGQMGAVIKSEQ